MSGSSNDGDVRARLMQELNELQQLLEDKVAKLQEGTGTVPNDKVEDARPVATPSRFRRCPHLAPDAAMSAGPKFSVP